MMDILNSKKFWVAIVTVCLMVLNELSLNIDVEQALAIISPLIAYIIGQGIADNGKERAKIEGGKNV